MSFNKKTVRDFDLEGKSVLIRVDYNVPLNDKGEISDDYRIKQSVPTLHYLLGQDCKVIIIAHLGRPTGPDDKSKSLEPIAKRLSEIIKQEVKFAHDCVGDSVDQAVKSLKPGEIILLENLRFHPEEEANDENFSKQLASLAQVFVQDGFGVVHRAHASTVGVTHFLPSIAGFLLEKEVDTITNVMNNPLRPLVAVIGGSKISDKIDVLNSFIQLADVVAVGGAMANTFLLAEGIKIGSSLSDPEDVPLAKDLIDKARTKARNGRFIFYIPQDGVVASSVEKNAHTRIVDWDAHVIADVESYPQQPPKTTAVIAENEKILDIGPFSGAFIAGTMQLANTVVWSGVLGVTETPGLQGPVGPFAHGTELIIDALLGQFGHKPYSLIGGGDTSGYIEQRKLVDSFNHVSTGGTASLELMSGKALPGVESLLNKDSQVIQ